MRRDLFDEDHEAFRQLAREFVEKEVVPHYPAWEKGGRMPRDVFKQMGGHLLVFLPNAVRRKTDSAAARCAGAVLAESAEHLLSMA